MWRRVWRSRYRYCQRGFSLVELLIVVALIGILAAIAIPNFLSYQARAKQSEAKTNLVAIHTAELAYFAEHNAYAKDFGQLGFAVMGTSRRYHYTLGGAKGIGDVPAGCTDASAQVSATGFTAVAMANLDGDVTCDVWTINEKKEMVNTMNDVAL